MQSFPDQTQACEDRNFVEWHRGCLWCAVWVLRVDVPGVDAWVAQARDRLAPWLLPRYERQPHITLAYRGLMPAEFVQAQQHADVRALQQAQLSPFAVRIQGTGSFSTVPYLGVDASTMLLQAHAALVATAPYPDWQYVPHVTLGHYGCQVPMEMVLPALQAASAAIHAPVDVAVDALWLARYRTDDIAGPLSYEGRFDLQTQTYQANSEALISV